MAGFGDNTFGYLKWGLFGDENVNVTNPNDTLWGKDSYGQHFWNGGGNMDSILADISITAEVNVGWGARTWGYPEGGGWGDLFDTQVSITGFGLSNTLGEETVAGEINTGYGRLTWGANGWGIAGTLQATGIEMSSDIGSVSIANEINTGWGSDTWGYETWGQSGQLILPTGIQLTGNVNSVSISADGEHEVPTGISMSATLASASIDISLQVIPTGIGFDIDQGSVTTQANADVIPSGIEMTMQESSVEAYNRQGWGRYYWGLEEWGASGEWEFVDVSGVSLTMDLASVEATPNTIAALTGIQLNMQEGDETVTGNARVSVTGNALTMASGTLRTLIWNEVNTGTAPIVPPGWQEVDTAA
jgi:hypothetical protein